MNPAEKGWLKEYIGFRNPHPIDLSEFSITNHRNSLYKILQPTGLIYGHPIHPPGLKHPKAHRWNSLGRRKIVVIECFFHSAILNGKNSPQTTEEWKDFYYNTSCSIGSFYCHLDPHLSPKSFLFFKKPHKEELSFTERILHKKLLIKSKWDPFWISLFQNSLIFLDSYYFGEWHAGRFSNIKWHKDAMKLALLRIIAASAHANQIIKRAEKTIFNTFLESSKLSKEQEKTAKKAFREGITLDQIDLRFVDTWLLKKYVLELTILIIWADKVIADEEKAFLSALATRLGFNKTDLDASLIAIEAFVIENWKDVYFLQSKHSFQIINQTIHERIVSVMNNYKERIIQELVKNRALQSLIEKSRIKTLDEMEKEIVRIELIKVLKAIPSFETVSLPSNFLTLPILIKLLPKEILPINLQA